MSPTARDGNESPHASNRLSTIHTTMVVALVSTLAASAGIKIMTILRPDLIQGTKAVAMKEEENADTLPPLKIFGKPFVVPVQTKDMKEPQQCPVAFLNDGFDLQVHIFRFELKDLFVENTGFSPESIQSMLKMANPDGLTHVEYDEAHGLIFHAGEQCSICIPLEDTHKMFTDLAFSANTDNVRSTKSCNGLTYRFLKMPPMLSFLLSETGNCSVVLNQMPTEEPEDIDNRVAHSLK